MPEPEHKFVILSMGRIGSTLLTSLINSHSEIYCEGEIFMRKQYLPILLPASFLKGHSRNVSENNATVYGFKVKEEQLSKENKLDSALFLQRLHHDGWKVIRLTRNNRIKLALSIYQAWKDNIYEVKAGGKPHKITQIPVEIDKLIEILDFHDHLFNRENEAVKDVPHLALTFEEDLLDNKMHQTTANKVFDFLNLSHQPVSTEFIKKSDNDLHSLVKNYAEIALRLKNTKYAGFLDE